MQEHGISRDSYVPINSNLSRILYADFQYRPPAISLFVGKMHENICGAFTPALEVKRNLRSSMVFICCLTHGSTTTGEPTACVACLQITLMLSAVPS